MAVEHYENFPVASWLCPARIRPAVVAIYWFARHADDIADEGQHSAAQRLAALAQYRQHLQQAAQGQTVVGEYASTFTALAQAIVQFQLPVGLLEDLLTAFEQDVRRTAEGLWYAQHDELLHYARYSANPVGRLLLHLYGVRGEAAERESDAICSALQLINFWQDLSQDLPRARYYLPTARIAAHGLSTADILAQQDSAASRALIAECCAQARSLMLQGQRLPSRIGGRSGLELRLVMAGGLRILDRLHALGYNSLSQRPKLSWADGPPLLYKAFFRLR